MSQKRESKLTYDPVGWHNYKFFYGDGKKEAWLDESRAFDRVSI